MIRDRPAYIQERLEVGHWKGDLIIGNCSTALATLVERMTRYTVLVQLPGKRTMEALNASLEAAFAQMTASLVRTLTWDQGKEIAGHSELAAATGLALISTCATAPVPGSGERTRTSTASSVSGGLDRRTSRPSTRTRFGGS